MGPRDVNSPDTSSELLLDFMSDHQFSQSLSTIHLLHTPQVNSPNFQSLGFNKANIVDINEIL